VTSSVDRKVTGNELRQAGGAATAAPPTRGRSASGSRVRRKRQLGRAETVVIGVSVLVIGYLVVTPLWYLMWGTFFGDEGFSLDSFARAFGDRETPRMILNSLVFAGGAAVLATVLGTFLAYVNVRTDVPFRGLVFAGALLPLILPSVLYVPAWVFLGSENVGVLNTMVRPIVGRPLFDIYSMEGMIWIQGLQLVPIVFLLMVTAFRSMDPSLEESALVSGARKLTVVRRITLPLVRPALMSAFLIVLVLSLESFEVPAMIGASSGIYVFTSRIYLLWGQYPVDLGALGALSVGLLAIALLAMLLGRLGRNPGSGFQTVTGKAFRPRPMELGRARPWVAGAVLTYFIVAVAAPVLVIIYGSMLPYFSAPSMANIRAFTLDNYREVLETPRAMDAVQNTLILAVSSATAAVVLAAVASWLVVRSSAPGRSLVDGLALSPLFIPGMVLGLSLSFVYLRSPLPIYGTLLILVIAFTTRFLPFAMRYTTVAMQQVAHDLEESARVSGASWWQTLRRVLLPLAAPGLISAWIFVFMVSFRELSSAILLFDQDTETLSIMILRKFSDGELSVVAAMGVLMTLFLVAVLLLAYRLGGRVGVKVH
jgi:iron(III) transport system permease protein